MHRYGNKCAGGKNVKAEQVAWRGRAGGAHNGKKEALDWFLRGGGAWQQLPIGIWVRSQHLILAGIPLLFLEHPLMHQRDEEKDDSSNDGGHAGKVEGHMVVPKTVAEKACNGRPSNHWQSHHTQEVANGL